MAQGSHKDLTIVKSARVDTVRLVRELVGVAEIAELLGMSRQRVHQLAKRDDFPRPIAVLSAGAVWERRDVEKWARQTGRLGTDE